MQAKDLVITGNANIIGSLKAGNIQAAGTIRTSAGEVSINGHTHSYLPLSGGTMTGTGQIRNSHTGGSWIFARDNALIRHDTYTSSSSYSPIFSCKISDGEISNGIIHPENRLVWAYTADSSYPNSNSCTVLMGLGVNSNGGVLSNLYSVTSQSFNANSDKRLKENLEIYSCNKSILDLPIYKYTFINDETKKERLGCLAQDLQEICPEIVHTKEDGYLTIEESKIVYLLLEEVKQLKTKLDLLAATALNKEG